MRLAPWILPSLLRLMMGLVPLAAWGGPQRSLELIVPPAAQIPAAEPAPAGEAAQRRPDDAATGAPQFLGERDDDILERICHQPVKSVRPLGGGSSISLRMVFADGSQAAVKPEQIKVTRYQSEVAAYAVSRALRLGRVAPSCVRSFPKELLMGGMPQWLQQRMQTEMKVDEHGQVACAVIYWIQNLKELHLEAERADWQQLLRRGTPLAQQRRQRALDIATMLLFDYLVVNDDRWSGGQTHEVNGQLIFLDQGAAFGSDRAGRRQAMFSQLRLSQRFEREVVQALRRLDLGGLQGALRPLLSGPELRELEERVDEARRYIEKLEEEAPGDSVL